MLDPSNYVDLAAEPARPLPSDLDSAIAYLTAVLGTPVYQTWTPARLLEEHGSMSAAKVAQPEVFALLLGGGTVVRFWDLGQSRTVSAAQAPGAEAVVGRLLRTLRVRFRPAHPPTSLTSGPNRPGAAAVRPDLHPARRPVSEETWLAGTGRLYNSDLSTNTLGVCDDGAAVHRFLQERASGSRHTHRAYTAEIRRLIRWCQAHGVTGPLSALTRATLLDYRDGRRGATPAEYEGGERSEAAQQRTMAVLRSLFGFLSSTGYLMSNPCARLGSTAAARAGFRPERILPPAAVEAIDRWLREQAHSMGQRPHVARRAAALAVFRFAGVRLDELATREGFPRLSVDADGWTLTVMGKGQKKRSIPLPDSCTLFLKRYRIACGLPATPSPAEVAPLIRGERGGGLGPSGLYRVVKSAFQEIAAAMPESNTARLVLESASPHWLRHLVGKTLVIDRKVPLPMAAALLGHGSVVTTAGYSQTDLSELRAIMEESFPVRSSEDAPQPEQSLTPSRGQAPAGHFSR
ncbi:integrase [Paraburkholderia guartelaensis]|uniref:Integrase n=1 Tax=Paraburkholderia guartelaensis TaxID=2546446 RepID=A0A4R5L4R7_9BURK|nr:tyrosine-type recombinase/integrase [Paraburkholderia guartelaensis]TDG02684.1 integrase [Paraburkholderia guartelaensis]